jgi:hypothetical protein
MGDGEKDGLSEGAEAATRTSGLFRGVRYVPGFGGDYPDSVDCSPEQLTDILDARVEAKRRIFLLGAMDGGQMARISLLAVPPFKGGIEKFIPGYEPIILQKSAEVLAGLVERYRESLGGILMVVGAHCKFDEEGVDHLARVAKHVGEDALFKVLIEKEATQPITSCTPPWQRMRTYSGLEGPKRDILIDAGWRIRPGARKERDIDHVASGLLSTPVAKLQAGTTYKFAIPFECGALTLPEGSEFIVTEADDDGRIGICPGGGTWAASRVAADAKLDVQRSFVTGEPLTF